jgi:mannose-6-phosphate isomerase-like protein (cupin superfamily)
MEFSKRKWGWYLTIWSASGFKIKFLYFRKGSQLSKQRHFKRSELWLFMFGNGWFMTYSPDLSSGDGGEVSSGDCFTVPVGYWHKYTALNRTLVLEIQTGHCVESDIERKC